MCLLLANHDLERRRGAPDDDRADAGFLDAARLSGDWLRRMSQQALLLEAHHTIHGLNRTVNALRFTS